MLNNIKKYREKLNLTQKETAQRLGVAPQVFQRYEYGQQLPNVKIAIALAVILKTSVEELFNS